MHSSEVLCNGVLGPWWLERGLGDDIWLQISSPLLTSFTLGSLDCMGEGKGCASADCRAGEHSY